VSQSNTIGDENIMTTKISKEKNFYVTSDLALATTLSLFYPIEAIDKQSSKRAYFVFRREKGLEELIEKYWRSELRIDPKMFFAQLKIIKTRLYESE
jgi:hypothetical protein